MPRRRSSQGDDQQRWLSAGAATNLQSDAGGKAACSEAAAAKAADYVEVSPIFTTSTSLLLIKMKLSKTKASTISQSELLSLFQLAKARKQLIQETAKDQPIWSALKMSEDRPVWTTETPYKHDPDGPGAQQQTSRRKQIRVHPLDVCALLLRGEIGVSDLPLLNDLDKVAEEAETAQQREGVWWWLARFFGLQRRRQDIWAAAESRLQQHNSASTNVPVHRGRKHFELTEDAALPDVEIGVREGVANNAFSLTPGRGPFQRALPSGISSKGLSLGPATGAATAAADAAATSGLSASMQRRKVLQPTAGSQQAAKRPSIASSFKRFPGSTTPPTEEEAGDCAGAAHAAAAAVSRLSSDSLVLLPHGCKWPCPVGAVVARPQALTGNDNSSAGHVPFERLYDADLKTEGRSGNNPWRAGSPPSSWKAAVGFQVSRGRGISGRKRELARQRQRLSPLDPPFTADALLLHPFSPIGAVDLPDAEMSRASEVHEVSLDFLSRTMATEACPQCSRAEVPVGREPGDSMAERCPLHQRLHYKKVGEGPEKVILIHGICMSGYFFADVIRIIFPEEKHGLLGGYSRDEGPHESWRYTFYCVDLLGYGKSSAVPSTQNYSRREQANAILRDVIIANGFTSVHLVGHSFGGLVAAELCEMLPAGFVTTLILMSPAYFESERQAMRTLTGSHFPAAHTVAHPYFGEFMLRLSVVLRPLFEPLVLSIVPKGELPPLSVADVFSIHPDALTGTIRSIVQDRVDRTLQLLHQRGQRASLFHGTADGVIPIRQARFLALRYPNIHVRALAGFVHHFPASHAQFSAHIITQEIRRSLRKGRGLSFELDGDPASSLIASHALLLPGHPAWN